MNRIVLESTRIFRIFSNDTYVPKRCNAKSYITPRNTKCDCKIWCKYPPRGLPVSFKVLNTTKSHLNNYSYIKSRSNGTPQLHSRY
jgi:hypothetical protein